MKSFDEHFYKEFENMMRERSYYSGNLNLYNIPFPTFPTMVTDVLINKDKNEEELNEKERVYIVKNLKEPYFDKLNDAKVKLVTKDEILKRRADSTGKFLIKDGEFIYEKITVPRGFKVIHSNIPIGLKNKVVVRGVEKLYKPSEGFRYVDYFESAHERRYIYIIPEENIEPTNMSLLLITSEKNRRNKFYKGYKVALQTGHTVNLYVTDWKEKSQNANDYVRLSEVGTERLENNTYHIIGAKVSVDFEAEIDRLFNFWTQRGVMFDKRITTLDNPLTRNRLIIENVGVIDIPSTLNLYDFNEKPQ